MQSLHLGLVTSLLTVLVAAPRAGSAQHPGNAPDSVLFSLVLSQLRSERSAAPGLLYVHSTPIAPDPAIVSIGPLPVPPLLSHATRSLPDSGFIPDSAMESARLRVLRGAGFQTRSIVDVVACGTIRFKAMEAKEPNPAGKCMSGEELWAVAVALPRAGGRYTPGARVEPALDQRPLVSVRVIRVYLGVSGIGEEVASDYIFERTDSQEWKFVRKEVLVIAG